MKQRMCGNLGTHRGWTLDCYAVGWGDSMDVYVSPEGEVDWTIWGMGWAF